MLRLRNDLNVKLPSDFENIPSDVFERVEWLENIRENGEIDGFITTRTLHSSLKNKPRRHTLGMQRKDDARSRFIPIPLEGYTVLLTRKDFPASRFSKVIDMGAALSLRLELTVLDSIESNMRDKIGLVIEQRKFAQSCKMLGIEGNLSVQKTRSKNGKHFSGSETYQGPKTQTLELMLSLKQ